MNMQLWNYVSNREQQQQQLSFIPIERHIVYNDTVTVQEFWMTMWEQKVYTIYSRKWKVLDDNWKLCFGNLPLTEPITSRTELFDVGDAMIEVENGRERIFWCNITPQRL